MVAGLVEYGMLLGVLEVLEAAVAAVVQAIESADLG
jgi:hypothetical protein